MDSFKIFSCRRYFFHLSYRSLHRPASKIVFFSQPHSLQVRVPPISFQQAYHTVSSIMIGQNFPENFQRLLFLFGFLSFSCVEIRRSPFRRRGRGCKRTRTSATAGRSSSGFKTRQTILNDRIFFIICIVWNVCFRVFCPQAELAFGKRFN